MTTVAFHFNAPSKCEYACRLLRKALASGATVAVVAESELLRQLDIELWSFSSLDFLPHAIAAEADSAKAALTPILLCEAASQGHGRGILVNLASSMPAGFEAFDRVIEVVTPDEHDRQAARERWKSYASRGFELVRHDLSSTGVNT